MCESFSLDEAHFEKLYSSLGVTLQNPPLKHLFKVAQQLTSRNLSDRICASYTKSVCARINASTLALVNCEELLGFFKTGESLTINNR
jgi:hypothetical protein